MEEVRFALTFNETLHYIFAASAFRQSISCNVSHLLYGVCTSHIVCGTTVFGTWLWQKRHSKAIHLSHASLPVKIFVKLEKHLVSALGASVCPIPVGSHNEFRIGICFLPFGFNLSLFQASFNVSKQFIMKGFGAFCRCFPDSLCDLHDRRWDTHFLLGSGFGAIYVRRRSY